MTAVLRYKYDELGSLSKTIRPDGQEQVILSYGSGHVYGVAFNQQDMVGFQRDDLHRETKRFLANGLIQSSVYNDVGLLSSQQIYAEDEFNSQQYQVQRSYRYDKNYLLSQVKDSRLGQIDYSYDPIGRLVKTQGQHLKESFTFDPAGNLIDLNSGESQIKNNLIKNYQGAQYRYDAQGNVIEKNHAGQRLQLHWDTLNRLERSALNGQSTEYGYDVFGRRLFKKSADNGLTVFGWDGDLMIWESSKTQDDTQSYTKHYVYEPNSFVPLVQTGYSGFIQLIKTPDYSQFKDQPYSIHADPLWRTDPRRKRAEIERAVFYHCDQIGTPQALSNEAGELVWDGRFNTWGEALEIKASDNLLEQTNIRFQGQYYDAETGLHYNRYRYYEPHSARYVGKDPIGLNGGINTSSYVSDPNGWVDPMGLQKADYGNFKVRGVADWGRKQEYPGMLRDYDPIYTPKSYTPYTTMTTIGISGKLLAGASLSGGWGYARDKNGAKRNCGTINICGSGGVQAGVSTSLGKSYTNATTDQGISHGGAICVVGSAAALIGASTEACQNSDGSQTVSANLVAGGEAGVGGALCYAVNYCF